MNKTLLIIAVFTLFIGCKDENLNKKIPGSTLYEEILPAGRVDTTRIRFIFENEGNSKITGKVACSKDEMKSTGEYYKYSYKPLMYYMQKSPVLFNKSVNYFQVDSLISDTFRIKITFPDYTENGVAKKDTLVYKSFKKVLTTTL
jgi:hypothetical protein